MASMISKLARFAASPQGKQAFAKAKDYASKPENRAKIEQARQKLVDKRKGSRGTGRSGTPE